MVATLSQPKFSYPLADQHCLTYLPRAEKGEIVAAMIDGEATVKTWSKKDGHYWLLPANDDYAPIPADDAQILGKVTAVLRSV